MGSLDGSVYVCFSALHLCTFLATSERGFAEEGAVEGLLDVGVEVGTFLEGLSWGASLFGHGWMDDD